MAEPRPITEADAEAWSSDDVVVVRAVRYAADIPNSEPVDGLQTLEPFDPATVPRDAAGRPIEGALVVRVAWTLNEIDLMHLATGGTLWLSTWGGLPPHAIHVEPPR